MPSFDDPPPQSDWKSGQPTGSGATNKTPIIVGGVALALTAVVALGMATALRGSSSTPARGTSTESTDTGSSGNFGDPGETGDVDPLDMTGKWTGMMRATDHNYRFTMRLTESSGGSLKGEMLQVQTTLGGSKTGDRGVETMRGERSGRVVTLYGTGWDWQTPDGWYKDTIDVKLSPDGESFAGKYTCDVCDVHPIDGYRD